MRETSFGHMKTIEWGTQQKKVELLHFDSEGQSHSHPQWENATCISGRAEIMIAGEIRPAPVGVIFSIPPGVSHWMRPALGEECDWLIWYTDHPTRCTS